MTEADLAALRAGARTKTHRVAVLATSVGNVVVKSTRGDGGPWRRRLGNALARAAGLSFLQSPVASGAAAQQAEVGRLRALRAAGIAVPEVLLVDAEFFAMSHVAGPSLIDVIERDPAEALAWWRRGLEAIAAVHERGEYLSQAFARNFIVGADGLTMIDFEDDPRTLVSLDEAQARDWLAYLHSTAWRLRFAGPLPAQALAELLGRERPAVRSLVERAGRKLAWMRHLPRSRKPLGREAVGLQALAELFNSAPPLAPARH